MLRTAMAGSAGMRLAASLPELYFETGTEIHGEAGVSDGSDVLIVGQVLGLAV